MNRPSDERVTEWAGGTLSELMSVLSGAALPARIQVFGPAADAALAGEIHLLAGGFNDAFMGDVRGQDALVALQRVTSARFVIETCLPDPKTGSLTNPGPGEGNLAERPLVELMRYCEEYVLTCTLEVWRREEQASISYRRGELVSTKVGGSDAEDRLPEVMAWKEGFYEIVLPPPMTPPVPALSKRNTGTAAVVGNNMAGPTRPASGEKRKGTDPLISVKDIKRRTPTRSTSAVVRPEGEKSPSPRLPPGPPLPGMQNRGRLPSFAAASRAPVPPQASPSAPRPAAAEAPGLPVARGPARVAQVPSVTPPGVGRTAGAPQAPAVARPLAQPRSAPTATVASPTSRSRDPQATPSPAPTPVQAPAVRPRTPSPIAPPAKPALPLADAQPFAPSIPAPARPPKPRPAGPPALRGAAATAANMAPSVANRTSGEIRIQPTPVRGIDIRYSEVDLPVVDTRPSGVRLSDDMEDPAAYVDTPAPHPGTRPSSQMSTPTPIATPRHKTGRSSDRLSAFTSVQSDDLAADIDAAPARQGKRSARRKETSWTMMVLLGLVLGAAIVAAYSAYFGLPLRLP